jgi:carbon-monoxide dehydrogenase medium subunit
VTIHRQAGPPAFEYARPRSLAEVFALLEQHGQGARLLAGGSDLIVRVRLGHARPSVVIDLKRVPELTDTITRADGVLRVGARAVMTDIIADATVQRVFPALVEAARVVGSVQIRNRATLAGNICNASPAADTVTPLLAYGARVNTLRGGGERRTIDLAKFFTGPGRTVLEAGELVVSVDLPLPAAPAGSAFERLTRRRGVDLAVVNAAVFVSGGEARASLGAVGPTIFAVTEGIAALADPNASASDRQTAIARIAERATPRSDVRGAADYRQAMVEVLLRRAVERAHERLRANR